MAIPERPSVSSHAQADRAGSGAPAQCRRTPADGRFRAAIVIALAAWVLVLGVAAWFAITAEPPGADAGKDQDRIPAPAPAERVRV